VVLGTRKVSYVEKVQPQLVLLFGQPGSKSMIDDGAKERQGLDRYRTGRMTGTFYPWGI
jgi:hypothetical protein